MPAYILLSEYRHLYSGPGDQAAGKQIVQVHHRGPALERSSSANYFDR